MAFIIYYSITGGFGFSKVVPFQIQPIPPTTA
jgi:hypothetical protein